MYHRRRRRAQVPFTLPSDLDGAFAALSVDDLRALLQEALGALDEPERKRLLVALLQRAARSGTGWSPALLGDGELEAALEFLADAARDGRAEPDEIDELLRRASGAFLGRDYEAAFQLFDALLPPLGNGRIYLGQEEQVEDVLGARLPDCAAQYLVAAYLLELPADRATAVRTAIDRTCKLGDLREPIREMERVANDALPDLADFLPRWRALLEQQIAELRPSGWETDLERWRREVSLRLEGASGLARIARTSRREDDLRAWCKTLADARDWLAALAACDEAAELSASTKRVCAAFQDDAALAAQELGRPDLAPRLERAWLTESSLLRLCRWLGAAKEVVSRRELARRALDLAPTSAHRQRALLHLVRDELEPAATLLSAAPGLGWSNEEHPGLLLFPHFLRRLGLEVQPLSPRALAIANHEFDPLARLHRSFASLTPHLRVPTSDELIPDATYARQLTPHERKLLFAALKTSTEKRLDGVVNEKRRFRYGHAAALAAACLAVDRTPSTTAWFANLEDRYRRFPALRAELANAKPR